LKTRLSDMFWSVCHYILVSMSICSGQYVNVHQCIVIVIVKHVNISTNYIINVVCVLMSLRFRSAWPALPQLWPARVDFNH